jgi:tetratricopeptide (TPR) repeat protein
LAQNEYARAVELHQRALAIYERDPEANAGSIALTLNSLGGADRGLGHEDDALDYFQRALDLRSRTLGAEHVLVAQTENNVARALMDRGRAERATELLAHALPALERAYPPAHPTVLIAMNSLGEAQRRSGRLDDAEATFRRALAIHHNHETRASSQAVTVIGLGQTAQDAGDPASAVRWFEQSLRLLEHDSSDERRTRTHDLLQRAKAQLGAKR